MPGVRIRPVLSLLLVAVTAVTAATACGAAEAGRDGSPRPCTAPDQRLYFEGSTVDRIARAGRIRVGVKFDSPGVGYKDPATGELTGFDVEIAEIVACRLGIAPNGIEWVEASAKDRERLIQNDDLDVVIATYSITEERKRKVSFAGPYFRDYQTIMVRAGEKEITGPRSTRGKRVCSARGAVTLATIKLYGAIAVPADDYFQCVELLLARKVQAVTTLKAILAGQLTLHRGEVKIVGEPFDDLSYGIGLRKTDATFRRFLCDVLEEAYADGTWRRAYDATLGRSGIGAPVPPTVHRY